MQRFKGQKQLSQRRNVMISISLIQGNSQWIPHLFGSSKTWGTKYRKAPNPSRNRKLLPVNLSSIVHALQFAKTGSQQVHAGNSSTFHFALQTKAACEKS